MNARERLLMALNHEEPDRVPVDLWFTSEVAAALSAQHGGATGAALRVALGHDLVMTDSPNIGASYEVPGTTEEYVCAWGVRWRWVTNAEGGRYTEAVAHPLADARDLSSCRISSKHLQEILREPPRIRSRLTCGA
jgi:uroporphyrinogen decarboxylase